jgi:alpha-L-rhamnosidase
LNSKVFFYKSIGNTEDFETTFEPHFTIHGFRYVEVSGYPGEPKMTDIAGRVAHSDTPINGHFESSHPMVNQLAKNIVWGQRGNFISVPTGCSQRDERTGWMGDAGFFAHTSVYNADVAAFYTKWMRDVREAQSTSGGFSDVSPRIIDNSDGAPAWGDAGVIIPYIVWRMYGDLQIIEDNYKAMTKWIDYIESQNSDLIWRKRVNNNFGDWLEINAKTPKDVLSTAYFAYDALMLSKMAKAINKTSDSEKYLSLHAKISDAFMKAFVNKTDAKISGDTQTVYLLALAFEMLPKPLRALAANHLVDNIKVHGWHLTTGFVGLIRIMQ